MNTNEIPTPETDALGYIPTDIGAAWPLVEHAKGLERRLTVARSALYEILERALTVPACENIAEKALDQTAPKP